MQQTRLARVVPLALLVAMGWLIAGRPLLAQRLPDTIVPEHYDLHFTPDLAARTFAGEAAIRVVVRRSTASVSLNAAELQIGEVLATAGRLVQAGTITLSAERELALVTFPQPLPPGPATLRITYTGVLNDRLRGFYLSKGRERDYAVTQFESTDARRAFPSFDEPSFKATFDITLTVAIGDTAISNGALISDTPGPTPGTHTLRFATTPKMSSYLVAMAVGDWQCVSGGADRVPIRICATPDKHHLGAVALETAERILEFYNRYFAITYPFAKLDVLAVPDFAAGAMENTAAIFYRETDLLIDEATASLAQRKRVALVLAHEMAHQWFGDLVTMKWWNDIWLNEGFANWLETKPLMAMRPEWTLETDEVRANQAALGLDALTSTRSIRADVESPAEIAESFDAIAYQKGAAVLRMVESMVGAEAFRSGVNAYVERHAYQNAAANDFWSTLTATSGQPVDRVMGSFVDQPGTPLVSVASTCEGGRTKVTLSQKRYYADRRLFDEQPPQLWTIPVALRAGGGGAGVPVVRDLLTAAGQTFSLAGCHPWVFINAGAQGYYRTEYSPDTIRQLAARAEQDLTPVERISVLADEWAIARLGHHSVSDYLTLAAGLGGDLSRAVNEELTDRVSCVGDYLVAGADATSYRAWVRRLHRQAFDSIGWDSRPGGPVETDDRRALRATLVLSLGRTGHDPDVILEAQRRLDAYLRQPDAVDPLLIDAVMRVAVPMGNRALYDALKERTKTARSPQEYYRFLYGLTLFSDPVLLTRALELVTTPDVRSQDAALFLSRAFANPAGRTLTWNFLKTRWTDLEPKIAAGGDSTIVAALGNFCDAGARADIERFFTEHPRPAAARTLKQTLERIDSCAALKARESAPLSIWLRRPAASPGALP